MSDEILELPRYGPPTASHKEAAPMIKMVSKMLTPKVRAPRGRGIQAPQTVKVGHKKIKGMKPVSYW